MGAKEYFPNRKIDATHLHPFESELVRQLAQEIVNLVLYVHLETISSHSFVVSFIEPLTNSVLNVTHPRQIGKVLLKLVAVWPHPFTSIIGADGGLVGQRLVLHFEPFKRIIFQNECAHQ